MALVPRALPRVSITSRTDVPIPDPPFWKQPWLWDLAKLIAGAVGVILLLFGVLKPVLRSLADAGETPLAPCQNDVENQHYYGSGQNGHQSRSNIASFATDGG